ncbi:unnamed protein product [Urochloa humidicola]
MDEAAVMVAPPLLPRAVELLCCHGGSVGSTSTIMMAVSGSGSSRELRIPGDVGRLILVGGHARLFASPAAVARVAAALGQDASKVLIVLGVRRLL